MLFQEFGKVLRADSVRMWDQITGKSSTSTAKVSADATAMALNVGTQTTAMANQANTDTTSICLIH